MTAREVVAATIEPDAAARRLLAAAWRDARAQGGVLGARHLVRLLLADESGALLLRRFEVDRAAIQTAFDRRADGPGEVGLHSLLAVAAAEAGRLGASSIAPGHLLLALATGGGSTGTLLREHGVEPSALRTILGGVEGRPATPARRPLAVVAPILAAYGRDLTEAARRGQLDPVVGRGAEMERVLEVLNRRHKNAPVLLGPPGVGKTAIVEGLAARIAAGQAPARFRQARIVALDLTSLVGGARARGDFEERLRGILDEVERAAGAMILYVDEVHGIAGAGLAEGGFDFAAIVKPALARGALPLIGATTPDAYRRSIEADAALERRLTPIWVAEPDAGESLAILRGLRPRYAAHHRVAIADDALRAAVDLAARYLPERHLPDKAIDLIDEAASRVSLGLEPGANATPPGIAPLKVMAADIARVVAAKTGIPLAQIDADEAHRLLGLEARLGLRVVGQGRAVAAVAEAIRRARAGLGDRNRPAGSFLFLGPSGVGKTELARALAAALFGDEAALLRLDMSEFMERHNVARLFGAPPGYVGYDDGGALTEPVRRRPYRVILFDEFEKAHPDVHNALLQILDAGRMTDGHGRSVDFRNTVVIMTSNLGTGDEAGAGRLLMDAAGAYDRAALEADAAAALRRALRPEFRNRIDEVIVFEPLGERELRLIVELQLADLRGELAGRGLTLRLTPAARAALIAEGFSPAFGARPLRRAIQRNIAGPLATALLGDALRPGDVLTVAYRGGRFALRRHAGDPPADVEPTGVRIDDQDAAPPAGTLEPEDGPAPPRATSRELPVWSFV